MPRHPPPPTPPRHAQVRVGGGEKSIAMRCVFKNEAIEVENALADQSERPPPQWPVLWASAPTIEAAVFHSLDASRPATMIRVVASSHRSAVSGTRVAQ
jgi:hypothetical protein